MGFMLAICFHSVCALHHGQILTAVHGLLWPLRCKLAARHTLPVLQSCGLVHCAQMVASATGSGNSSTIMRIFLEDLEIWVNTVHETQCQATSPQQPRQYHTVYYRMSNWVHNNGGPEGGCSGKSRSGELEIWAFLVGMKHRTTNSSLTLASRLMVLAQNWLWTELTSGPKFQFDIVFTARVAGAALALDRAQVDQVRTR